MQQTNAIRNFLFHRVNPERDPLWDPMDPKRFEQCIKYISRHYEVDLLENIVAENKQPGKKKLATISFDDGYKDNIAYAAPILEKYKCKASFYVVIDCLDNNRPPWTHILEHCFLFTAVPDIQLDFDFLPARFRTKRLASRKERIAYVIKVLPLLKTLPNDQRELFMKRVTETYSDTKQPAVMMNWNDLRELKKQGHYIGSHTLSHCMLATVTDEKELSNELLNSARRIEKELGYFPFTISYPGGIYNEATKEASRKAGYRMGLAVKQDIYYPGKDDAFDIPRISLNNEPWWKNYLRITHILEKVKTIIRYR